MSAPGSDPDPAERMVAKLRAFAANDLDPSERAALAALLAPGVARALADDEVTGYAMEGWASTDLLDGLRAALRKGGIRVEGLDR